MSKIPITEEIDQEIIKLKVKEYDVKRMFAFLGISLLTSSTLWVLILLMFWQAFLASAGNINGLMIRLYFPTQVDFFGVFFLFNVLAIFSCLTSTFFFIYFLKRCYRFLLMID